jgi:hypothetical protein
MIDDLPHLTAGWLGAAMLLIIGSVIGGLLFWAPLFTKPHMS